MPLLTFTFPLFSLLLFSTTTTTATQPYNATDRFFLACGSPSTTTTTDPKWDSDQNSKFLPSNINTISFPSSPFQPDSSLFGKIPYSFARVSNSSSFTYTFPVSQGPKFLRLHFYPATYSDLKPEISFFSVTSNGFSLLTNFSAFLTASSLEKPSFIKEYMIYVTETHSLTVTFTPSPNSYAFINGIEIVSMPDDLYFNSTKPKFVGMNNGPVIDSKIALENIYRLNMGGGYIPGTDDTGMYRSWEKDDSYIFGAIGLAPVYDPKEAIVYTKETPNYTAPEEVYRTQRSMGNLSDLYNLTWILPVNSGFYYNLRFHFCSIIPQYNKSGQVIFKVFINNQTADDEIDLFRLTQGSGYPVYKDYVVFVDPDGSKGKQDLWVAMHPNPMSQLYRDAYLNGLEAFKLSMNGSLACPNPELSRELPQPKPASPVSQDTEKTVPIIGGVVGVLVLTVLILLVFGRSHIGKLLESTESSFNNCRRFSLREMRTATRGFADDKLLGEGGSGKVYEGQCIDKTKTAGCINKPKTIKVAIKRLKRSSDQTGSEQFFTELAVLSKLRHDHLVSLIGYCYENEEMILVYDYMPNGTLEKRLQTKLSWEERLRICIGAAKGLHYLHTGADRVIIHRDVKSSNILLDEELVGKLSDFGLTKLGPKDPSVQTHVTTHAKGTQGYMDPAYYRGSRLTEKSDVYSFGVVLLEVLSAKPAHLPEQDDTNLAELGKSCYQNKTMDQIIDQKIIGKIDPKCFTKFVDVAISCLNEERNVRPAMQDVIRELEGALELQEYAEKPRDQQFQVPMQAEPDTTDEDALLGSSKLTIRHDTPSTGHFT